MFHFFQSGSIKIRMGESREWGLLGVVCGQGWRAGPLTLPASDPQLGRWVLMWLQRSTLSFPSA